jgi:hypothetical protein
VSASQNYVSDELKHFVGGALATDTERFELFLRIVGERWLRASYREKLGPGIVVRSDGREELSSNEAVISTTLCFCDIPEDQLRVHIEKYGPFGIAFPKDLLIRKGASPVFYVARNASVENLEPGIGERTLGQRFDQLQRDLAMTTEAFERYVWSREPQGIAPDSAESQLSSALKALRRGIRLSASSTLSRATFKSLYSHIRSFSRWACRTSMPITTTWSASGAYGVAWLSVQTW